MSLFSIGLVGDSVETKEVPEVCTCESKRFYKQTDFNRNLGLTGVAIAAIATFYLAYQGYSWLVTWSPMPIALVIDWTLARTRPQALICYKCSLIYRGISKEKLKDVEDFSLEVYDRIQYQENEAKEQV
jgi:hypothetical protein